MTPKERLQYALYLKRLHELFVIKENIAWGYQHKNYNKAAAQIDKVVDKCLDNNIKFVVDGTTSFEKPNLDHVITQALHSQRKMLVKTEDKFIQNAVEQNTKQYTSFIQNRIEKENVSLQAKIEKEYQKEMYNDMSEEEAKKLIRQKFQDSARKRCKNIVKDALHTNESQISWTYNVNNGMKYKVWMNGQGKSRVRPWHVKSKILPVEIDDFFDIFGPRGHAQMMYPGDLNGGAENVANCRCWLYYTNTAPSNLKPRGTIQVNPNVTLENENRETFSANTESKGRRRKSESEESPLTNENKGFMSRIKNKITNTKEKIKNRFENPKQNTKGTVNNNSSDNDVKPKKSLYKQEEKNSKFTNFRNKTKQRVNKLIKPIRKKLTPTSIDFEGITITQNELVNYISYRDLKKMLNKLPKGLTANLEQIIINPNEQIRLRNGMRRKVVGSVHPKNPTVLKLFKTDLPIKEYYYTVIHELAHVLDSTIGGEEYYISNSKAWNDAHINDKKHISKLEEELGVEIEYSEFVSDYAEEMYIKHLKRGQDHRKFAEDFADSVKLYFILGDETFSYYYPNRAKIIREVLGV